MNVQWMINNAEVRYYDNFTTDKAPFSEMISSCIVCHDDHLNSLQMPLRISSNLLDVKGR